MTVLILFLTVSPWINHLPHVSLFVFGVLQRANVQVGLVRSVHVSDAIKCLACVLATKYKGTLGTVFGRQM